MSAKAPTAPLAPLDPAGLVRRLPLAPHQLGEPITAQRDLFVLAHLGIARIDPGTWQLEIGGLVEQPLRLDFAAIRRLPKREVQSFHQCAGHPRRPEVATRRVGNVVWGGADLAALLAEAAPFPEARFLHAWGLDHGAYDGEGAARYVKDLALSRLEEGGVLLAYEVNGEPLMPEHGFPLRLIIPGYYGTNTVKWLTRLELARERAGGPFTTVLYNDPAPEGGTRPVWAAPPESLIVAPAPGPLPSRAPLEIWGWAWGAEAITRVEVSADGGASWAEAALEPRRDWSWQRFALPWSPAAKGPVTLMVRASDGAGRTQPAERARNAIHKVLVLVP
jgi:sulfane dehydrogenase subunit SoxC